MLLEIATTCQNASDLGYLLMKNPANIFERELPFGIMRVFYPEATEQRCRVILWLDLDQADLVRRHGKDSFALSNYVNDRPYVGSSYLSVAIGQAFGTALAGRSKDRPLLVDQAWPLIATLPVIDCDAGEEFIRRVFEPLGYQVEIALITLDTQFPEWGASDLYTVTLTCNKTVKELLTHLYVLLPVLDNQKHYAFGRDEIDKLVNNSGDWLANHPEREIIARRYLRYKRDFIFDALEKLALQSDVEDKSETEQEIAQVSEDALERPVSLHKIRLEAVAEALKANGGRKVVDLGCGEGRLIQLLIKDRQWQEIVGLDVSSNSLQAAYRKLHLERENLAERVKLLNGSLLYRDDRIKGFDAAALVEVIEHIEPDRLEFVERSVFGHAHPKCVVVTTPNSEYNRHWESLPVGKMRHSDHRFEWDRSQFDDWTSIVAERYGYNVMISGIGEPDDEIGAPTQMAVFVLK